MTQFTTASNRRPDSGLDAVIQFLKRLEAERFFGTLELRYQAGGIAEVLQHTSFKAHELNTRPVSRSNHDESSQQ